MMDPPMMDPPTTVFSDDSRDQSESEASEMHRAASGEQNNNNRDTSSPLQSTTKTNTGARPPSSAPTKSSTSTMTTPSSSSKAHAQQSSPQVSKSSFLTRKAHKFSSLKKKKGASTLLTKLFCNVGTPIAAAESSTSAENENSSSSSKSTRAPQTPALADEASPQTSADSSPVVANDKDDDDDNNISNVSCVTFSQALEQASESLTLGAETHVSSAIQEAFTQVTKEVQGLNKTGDSTKTPPRVGNKNNKTMKTPGGMDIPTPAVHKHSLFPSTLDTVSLFGNKRGEVNSSSPEKDDSPPTSIKFATTPDAAPTERSISLLMTPSDEPTASQCTTKIKNTTPGSLNRFIVTTTKKVHNSPKKPFTPVKSPVKRARAPVVEDDDDDDDDAAFLPDDFKLDTVVTIEAEPQGEAKPASEPVPVPVPEPPVVVATASITPVKSLSSPTRDIQSQSPAREMGRRYTWGEMERRIAEGVETAKDEWKKMMGEEVRAVVAEEQDQKLDLALKASRSEAEVLLHEHSEQWKQEHEQELKQIKTKYERKINELKDQSALAVRSTKQRETELEVLETELETLKTAASQVQVQPTPLPVGAASMKNELEQVRKELVKEMEGVTSELAAVKEQLTAKEKEAADTKAQLSAKEKEATNAKARLSFLEKVTEEAKSKSTSKLTGQEPEAGAAQDAGSKLPGKESGTPRSKSRVSNLEKEMAELKTKLFKKEMEVVTTKAQLSSKEKEATDLKAKLAFEKKEAAEYKDKLASQEKEAAESKAKLASQEKEAADLMEKLSMLSLKEQEQEASASAAKLTSQQVELDSLTLKLAAKDQEMTAFKEQLAVKEEALKLTSVRSQSPSLRSQSPSLRSQSPSLRRDSISSSSPSRLSTRSHVFKSPSRIGSTSTTKKPGSNSKPRRDSEPVENNIELHEREKESLRIQIATLEEQLVECSIEHERALQQLRVVSETELFQVKKDMENKLEYHMSKERELKETLSEVGSRDKEELLEKIEHLEAEKKADRNGGLREVQKKEDLLQRIATLEKMEKDLVADQERVLQDVRDQSEGEIQQLKKELEKQRSEQYAKERELHLAISETSSFEKEELLVKVEKLESKLDNERNGSVLVKMKIAVLEKELKAEEKKHGEEMQTLRSATDAEVKRLQDELDALCAVQEESQTMSKERDALLQQLKEIREKIEPERSEHKHKLDELRKQNMEEIHAINLRAAADLEITLKDADERVEVIQRELEKKAAEVIQEFEIVTQQSSTEERELRDRVELFEAEAITSKKEYEQKVQQLVKDHTMQLDEYEQKVQQLVKDHTMQLDEYERKFQQLDNDHTQLDEYERKLQQLDKDHTLQLDELLAQLDLIEAEHRQKVLETEKTANEKDAIIAALGAQLADARTREKEVDATHEKLTVNLARVQAEAATAKENVENMKNELDRTKSAYENFMIGEAERRERACDEAREEMIGRAEIQFKAANDLYVKLKKEYDSSIAKVERVESELKGVKSKLEAAKNEKEEKVADLKAEVADLKATNARTESDAAHRSKEYRREMEGLLKAAKDFETKLVEAESASRSLEKSLSAVVSAKTKLQQEYDEMKSVCEELMVLVEGNEQPRHEC